MDFPITDHNLEDDLAFMGSRPRIAQKGLHAEQLKQIVRVHERG